MVEKLTVSTNSNFFLSCTSCNLRMYSKDAWMKCRCSIPRLASAWKEMLDDEKHSHRLVVGYDDTWWEERLSLFLLLDLLLLLMYTSESIDGRDSLSRSSLFGAGRQPWNRRKLNQRDLCHRLPSLLLSVHRFLQDIHTQPLLALLTSCKLFSLFFVDKFRCRSRLAQNLAVSLSNFFLPSWSKGQVNAKQHKYIQLLIFF